MTAGGLAIEDAPDRRRDEGPVFVAGADRSGIGILGELLEGHPRLALTRRTDFWSRVHGRYGDLRLPENLDRCLRDLSRDRRLRLLVPDRQRLVADLADGDVDYPRLFALLQQQRAERLGRPRWGDKSLDAERHADLILGAYPTARMIHVLRDPRDRYASYKHHRRAGRGDLAAGVAVWLRSARLAVRNPRRHRGRYLVVRYEDLVREPVRVVKQICQFIGEDPAPLLADGGCAGGAWLRASQLHSASIGTHRTGLVPAETAVLQLVTGRWMRRHGYQPDRVLTSPAAWLEFVLIRLPVALCLLAAWGSRERLRRSRPPQPR